MEIELTYKLSHLDNEKQFGIKIIDEREIHQIYIRWVFYYLGVYLGEKSLCLYCTIINNGTSDILCLQLILL